jgi:hypothetical protein
MVKNVSFDEFIKRTWDGYAPVLDVAALDGCKFECTCGQTHCFDAVDTQVIRQLPEAHLVLMCPKKSMATCVRIKGKKRPQLISLYGAQAYSHPWGPKPYRQLFEVTHKRAQAYSKGLVAAALDHGVRYKMPIAEFDIEVYLAFHLLSQLEADQQDPSVIATLTKFCLGVIAHKHKEVGMIILGNISLFDEAQARLAEYQRLLGEYDLGEETDNLPAPLRLQLTESLWLNIKKDEPGEFAREHALLSYEAHIGPALMEVETQIVKPFRAGIHLLAQEGEDLRQLSPKKMMRILQAGQLI